MRFMISDGYAALLAAWVLAALPVSGCAEQEASRSTPDATSTVRTGPYDECGNGMDDDGDGQIDEGCFCGNGESQPCFTGTHERRRVGLCGDGVQHCEVVGSIEFGHWGACTMDALPAVETCDGLDNDCDGAVDEGCPCTAGQAQDCGLEFLTEPCMGGTQECLADGSWTECLGAVGPTAETCGTGAGDRIDNDCDGATDEGCTCVPRPEICGDGVDNDCDETTDEPACSDSTPVDAGSRESDGGIEGDAATPDGGSCVPESCDGVDNDCDGMADEGCESTCLCAPQEAWSSSFDAETIGVESADDGTRILVYRLTTDGVRGIATYYAQVVSPSGAVSTPVMLYDGTQHFRSVRWAFDQFVVLFEGDTHSYSSGWPSDEPPFGWRVSPSGTLLGRYSFALFETGRGALSTPADIVQRRIVFVREDPLRRVVMSECRRHSPTPLDSERPTDYQCLDRALLVWTLDADLAPIGAPLRVNAADDAELYNVQDAVADGPTIAVVGDTLEARTLVEGLGPRSVQGWFVHLIRDGRITAMNSMPSSTNVGFQTSRIARGSDRFLACLGHSIELGSTGTPVCRFFGLDGAPIGSATPGMDTVLNRMAFSLAWVECQSRFVLAGGRRSDRALRVSLIDPLRGTHVETSPSTSQVYWFDQSLSLARDGSLMMAAGGRPPAEFLRVPLACR